MIILDGDVRESKAQMKQINKCNNILLSPGNISPERMIAQYIQDLSDEPPLWAKVGEGYNKQFCFRDIFFNEIISVLGKAKEWFNSQLRYWAVMSIRLSTQ